MRSKSFLEEGFLIILLVLAVIGLFWLFSPFLEALFFAMILATATFPFYAKILNKLNGAENKASAIMSFAVFITVIAPVSYLLLEVGIQMGQVYGQAQDWLGKLTPENFATINKSIIKVLPVSDAAQMEILSQIQSNSDKVVQLGQKTIMFLMEGIFDSTASFLTFIALAVFAVFFFYRDGRAIAHHLKILSPLDNTYDDMIMNRFVNLSSILLLSVLAIAFMQGITFAIVAWSLGLPGLFLGTAVAVTSFFPIVGAALVWLPVALFLAVQGDWVAMTVVLVVGSIVNGFIIDNVMRPWVINKISDHLGANDDNLVVANHTLITVLSTFAGLIHFGVIGLFFGPVIAAMAITILDVYEHKHTDLLDRT